MKPATATLWFFVAWASLPFAWNLFMLWRGNHEATVSTVVVRMDREYPMFGKLVVAAAAAVLAHWFWPVHEG